jgi:parallel beta-helix repeat protein
MVVELVAAPHLVVDGIMMHSHAPHQVLNGSRLTGNLIGLNNLSGDSGNMSTTGILIWSSAKAGAAPIANTEITGNTIIGGNHFGIWLVHTTKTKLKNNSVRATVPVYKANS